MRVEWDEFYDNESMSPDPENYRVWKTTYRGDVVGCVRAWGETRLVVMLDDGKVREIAATKVHRCIVKK